MAAGTHPPWSPASFQPTAGTPPPWSPPSLRPSVERPFLVKLLNNRIKKCRGCGREFSRKANGALPDPPLNLVISHEERQPYTDANNTPQLGKLQNVYYHPSLTCIRQHNPTFTGCQLRVEDVDLTPAHKTLLQSLGCMV